ncbi:hypothetical protein SCARR_04743 [Pontiella sulfatireligans]|uniref:Uncharacterized protein n=1 Tax=Pontiella sulfatireligans TaxID=2750658 RepID=A0A6C2UQZ5_9BACT|nr:hypothetical protein SCARR_04743 [Pontiella sulfatireligans]
MIIELILEFNLEFMIREDEAGWFSGNNKVAYIVMFQGN